MKKCHSKVHTDTEFEVKLKDKKKGLLKKYGALSVLNQIMPSLLTELTERYPDKDIYVTTGWETKEIRDNLGLPKDHPIDAWCIAATRVDVKNISDDIIDDVAKHMPEEIKQFRRQNRAIIHSQRERTYKVGKKLLLKIVISDLNKKNHRLKNGSISRLNCAALRKRNVCAVSLVLRKVSGIITT